MEGVFTKFLTFAVALGSRLYVSIFALRVCINLFHVFDVVCLSLANELTFNWAGGASSSFAPES